MRRAPRRGWAPSGGSLLLGTMFAALAWTCALPPDDDDEWPELPGSVGGAGPGAGGTAGEGGSTGGQGGQGGQGGEAVGGGGGSAGSGGACTDPGPGEPNNTEATALFLGLISDDDDAGGVITGTLADGNDVDWYTYTGVDTSFNTVDPTRDTFDPNLFRVCLFAECINGSNLTLDCVEGSTPATSPGGRRGCCKTGPFSLDTFDCDTSDDDTKVYIRVDQPAAPCLDYSVTYHY